MMNRMTLVLAAILACAVATPVAPAMAQEVSVVDRGCYADNPMAAPDEATGHDLDGAVFNEPAMTVDACFGLCYQQGFTVAGLQAGSRCYCGTEFGRFGPAEGACTTPCTGDPARTCGGDTAIHVYEFVTGAAAVEPPAPATPQAAAPPVASGEATATPVPTPILTFETVVRTPVTFPVGKWPEGLATDGNDLWVAESGERRIARLSSDNGAVLDRVRVGRLPVGLAGTPSGDVYAAVATDRTVWRQTPEGGGVIAQLRDYPQAIAADDGGAFVLTWVGGSSGETRVVRVDPATGRTTESAILPRNGFDIALAGDFVWTLHRYDGENRCELVALDRTTLAVATRATFTGFASLLTAGEGGLYAAGGEFGQSGLVASFDPVTGQEVARNGTMDFVGALATGGGYVIAVESGGRIILLSPQSLVPVRNIELASGGVEPRDVLALGASLFVTTHRGAGDGGSVVVVDDWQP